MIHSDLAVRPPMNVYIYVYTYIQWTLSAQNFSCDRKQKLAKTYFSIFFLLFTSSFNRCTGVVEMAGNLREIPRELAGRCLMSVDARRVISDNKGDFALAPLFGFPASCRMKPSSRSSFALAFPRCSHEANAHL